MAKSNFIYKNSIPSHLSPDNHYGLQNSKCGDGLGYYPPNTIGEAYYNKHLQEAASFNLNNMIRAENRDANNRINNIPDNNIDVSAEMIKSNDQPSLRQADVAEMEGGSTTGDFATDDRNYTGNSYLGNLQQLKAVENIDKMDASIPELPNTPANSFNYGATITDPLRQSLGISINDYPSPPPLTTEAIRYHNGFLRTQIGRRITVDFLVGSNQIVSKTGYLLGVAQDYILLNELDTNDITSCDFYTIKFMRFYY